jgi:putative nucleotidyltransferase with HDIG domain
MNAELPLLTAHSWECIRSALLPGEEAYLVGGSVRDLLLGRVSHDLDFIILGDSLAVGRRVADALGAPYYTLDSERKTGRVILLQPDGERLFLDFAALRASNLESDLRDRDFTINAIAIPLHDLTQLVDPLGGVADLRAGVLRPCSPSSFLNDPLRTLRAVRQAVAFELHILPDTQKLLRQALPLLPRVSPERLRDELFRTLDGPQPSTAIRALDKLGALPYLLPELPALKGIEQSPPHTSDVWTHTLGVVQKLVSLFNVLAPTPDPETASNLTLAAVSLRLGRYRDKIHEHLSTLLNPDRSLRALLVLAALYHDIGKPQTRTLSDQGRIHFYNHEEIGASIASQRAHRLRLSNDETERLAIIVRHHMRPLLLAQGGELPSRRAVYRFFRSAGAAGVDICLLCLADTLATYGPGLPQEVWARQVDVVRILMEAYWEQKEERLSPPALLRGEALIQEFSLQPGPQVGKLLEAIREAQATGEIHTRQQALDFARARLQADDLDQG